MALPRNLTQRLRTVLILGIGLYVAIALYAVGTGLTVLVAALLLFGRSAEAHPPESTGPGDASADFEPSAA